MPAVSPRARILAICSAPVVALLAVAAFAPLPYSVAYPGSTVNVLGSDQGGPVISISKAESRKTTGQLRMTTIVATGPDATVRLKDVIGGWFDSDRAVMPRDSVYPVGNSTKEIEAHNVKEMRESQDDATKAALGYLHLSAKDVKVRLRLAHVGGPSAGLLFSLGIVNKIDGDGRGGDLTGGRTIAGTGTITADGKVGAVGGVPLKTLAAKRDGATVFLVPKAECSEAKAELPKGLRLIPVTTLKSAVNSLVALKSGGQVPHC
ncbi:MULTISPECIES: S16 family serine protease [unclassified Streptomyces]|uniref:S16 family serine protease n=1 Tax=unclassified Streptomyces TaxID=2593676 RepID=UPI003369F8EB